MRDYFATEADTMIDIVRLTGIKIFFEDLLLTGIFIKLSQLNVNYISLFVYLYIQVLEVDSLMSSFCSSNFHFFS